MGEVAVKIHMFQHRKYISSIVFFPLCHNLAAYVFLITFQSPYPSFHLPFNFLFQKAVPTQHLTNALSLPSA